MGTGAGVVSGVGLEERRAGEGGRCEVMSDITLHRRSRETVGTGAGVVSGVELEEGILPQSTPPQNHQLNIWISNGNQVDDFMGELTL